MMSPRREKPVNTTTRAATPPAELGALMHALTGATERLQATHDALRAEVARLTRELSEANAQLERSRRLAALGEMAAGIAHEVRNPLGGIRLYARMLRDDLSDRPEQRRTAEKIEEAARSLEGVVRDVLDFSREFRLRAASLCAGDIFARAIAASGAGEPGPWRAVRVVAPAEGEGPEVEADGALLQQALVNILRNAMEAATEHGVATPVLTCDAVSCGERVVLRVRDNGPGVPEDVRARMFNPFFTTRAAGTGLGLAIVHRIVDAHGGVVRVHNAQEGGAVVELELPAFAAGSDRAPPRGASGADVGNFVETAA